MFFITILIVQCQNQLLTLFLSQFEQLKLSNLLVKSGEFGTLTALL